MGSQQLLLIVLSMVITGIAITVAITIFQANAVESSRASMIEDLLYFAGRARDYYVRPRALGGGGRDFTGLKFGMLSKMNENENGRYTLESVSQHEIVLKAIGKIVADNDTIAVRMKVNEFQNTIEILH